MQAGTTHIFNVFGMTRITDPISCWFYIVIRVVKGFCVLKETSAFGTCIQKYVIERYVCVIVFMVIAQTHVQAVATVH